MVPTSKIQQGGAKRLIVLEEKMSKVKEKAMVEEKKEMRKVEVEKEGRGGKKKTERLPKPGFPGNPFRCGQGLKCPWVDGERGPSAGAVKIVRKSETFPKISKFSKNKNDLT